jgi:hypothetical protein
VPAEQSARERTCMTWNKKKECAGLPQCHRFWKDKLFTEEKTKVEIFKFQLEMAYLPSQIVTL